MSRPLKKYYVRPIGNLANRMIYDELSRDGEHDPDRETIKLKSGEEIDCWVVNTRTMKAIEQTRRIMSDSRVVFQVFDRDDEDRVRDITFVVKKWRIGQPQNPRARVERANNLAASK